MKYIKNNLSWENLKHEFVNSESMQLKFLGPLADSVIIIKHPAIFINKPHPSMSATKHSFVVISKPAALFGNKPVSMMSLFSFFAF